MTNISASGINTVTLHEWITENLSIDKIKEKLQAHGHDDDSISEHISAFKKLRYAKRQNQGFVILAIGAFLGFVSCVLTLVNPIPELYNAILYGLTSVAIGIICWGLYYILE